MKASFPAPKPHAAFTLLELLTAATIFMTLALLIFRVFGSVSQVSQHYERKADATASCRQALDTLSQDIGTLVTRGGATLVFKPGNETVNDELRFLCFSRPMAEHPTARMTIAAYRIENRPHPELGRDIPMLVRGNAPVFWVSGSNTDDYRFPKVLETRNLTYSDVLSERVFRFQIVWIRADGEMTHDPRGPFPGDSAMEVDADGYIWIDLKEVRGFILSLAAIDLSTQRRTVNFAEVQRHFTALPASEHKVPAAGWLSQLRTLEPEHLRPSLQVAQRTYLFHR